MQTAKPEPLYYDIGLNLFCRQFKDPVKILADAAAAGVACILTGSDREENLRIHDFVKIHDTWGTAGIHPHSADQAEEEDFRIIRRIVKENPRIVAIGECGLDFDRMYSTRANQIACLERHIALAEELDMPLFLHEREASETFREIFRSHPEICRKSVVHCFTGDRETAEQYLEMGFRIGVTGWICDDRRAEPLRQAAAVIPADRILLETDAPYLIPRGIKGLGRVNVPGNIVYVADALAFYMGIDREVLVRAARANTLRLFSRMRP